MPWTNEKKDRFFEIKRGDIFLGKWIDKKRELKLYITKTNDTTYEVNVPAKTGSGFMGFQTTFKDNKLICGKDSKGEDWVILTFANEKVTTVMNGEEFEQEE